MLALAPARPHRPPSRDLRRECSAFWRFVRARQRTCSGFADQRPSCPMCIATPSCGRQVCACHARRPPSGRSCVCSAALRRIIVVNPNPWNASNRVRRSNLTSKTPPPCPPMPRANESRVVEMTNFVDAGTSIWLSRSVGGDFDAQTLLEVVAQFLRERGLPAMLTFDNDPRFVGSASGRDFPSARLALPAVYGG